MKVYTVRLNDDEIKILEKLMQKSNIKTISEAIRKCIRTSSEETREIELLIDMDLKLNKILSDTIFSRKLLEQLFVNTGFAKNLDVRSDECLKEFYAVNNKYSSRFIN